MPLPMRSHPSTLGKIYSHLRKVVPVWNKLATHIQTLSLNWNLIESRFILLSSHRRLIKGKDVTRSVSFLVWRPAGCIVSPLLCFFLPFKVTGPEVGRSTCSSARNADFPVIPSIWVIFRVLRASCTVLARYLFYKRRVEPPFHSRSGTGLPHWDFHHHPWLLFVILLLLNWPFGLLKTNSSALYAATEKVTVLRNGFTDVLKWV